MIFLVILIYNEVYDKFLIVLHKADFRNRMFHQNKATILWRFHHWRCSIF